MRIIRYAVLLLVPIGIASLIWSRPAPKTVAVQPKVTETPASTDKDPETIPAKVANPLVTPELLKYDIDLGSQTEPRKRYYLLDTPNDPRYPSSWYFTATNTPSAWNISSNSNSVTVAVIDTGFALAHQDLQTQWRINSGEYGGGKESDGNDNDNNGYVDDWRGWDFAQDDNLPQAGTRAPSGSGVSHGTEVSGLVGATSNNGLGVASISRGAQIMPLQVIDDYGNGFSDDVAEGIMYAVDNGASIINISLGTSGDDPLVREAVDYAFAHNVLVVAAAGNCGTSSAAACAGQPAGYVTFPASYNRVIAVGATDSTNARASFSSYGERLDLMAPGSGTIPSTTFTASNGTSAYATSLYGTSFASPIVASSAALIRSIRPDSSIDDIRALLMASANKLSPMGSSFYTQAYGHGLLNVNNTLQIATDLNSTTPATISLLQTGGTAAEHAYASNDTLASGCVAAIQTWCTTWLRSDIKNFERFLPYKKTSSNGVAAWSYSAASLNSGPWESRARQGDTVSDSPYFLLKK